MTVNLASNMGKETTLIPFDPHCLYAYHCMSACAQWHVYMHVCICVRMYAVLVCNMLYVYVGHTTGRKCIARCHNDISSTSERAFPVFFWRFFGVLNSLQKDVFEYTRINSLLVNGVVTASSHAL